MKRALGAALAALMCLLSGVAQAAETTIDLSPAVQPVMQVAAGLVSVLAVPLFWRGFTWLQSKLHLNVLAIDAQQRAVVDQGLEKAIGFAVSRVQGTVGGRPLTVDVKNQLVAQAATFALGHIPDALAHFGITEDQIETSLGEMIEARLGLAAVNNSPVASPVQVAAAPTPLAAAPSAIVQPPGS